MVKLPHSGDIVTFGSQNIRNELIKSYLLLLRTRFYLFFGVRQANFAFLSPQNYWKSATKGGLAMEKQQESFWNMLCWKTKPRETEMHSQTPKSRWKFSPE